MRSIRIVSAFTILAISTVLVLALGACAPTEKTSHDYFPVNDAGYSYGSADDEFVKERYIREFGYPETDEEWQDYMRATTPDLILASADDGTSGYVFEKDFGEPPKNPIEARRITEKYEEGFTVDVYDAQTMEVIGTMTVGGNGKYLTE